MNRSAMDNLSLSHILHYLPRAQQREDRPPFLRTLALLQALGELGAPCELWNGQMSGRWATLVVAGIRWGEEILDWNGHDPRDYPRLYPALEGAALEREGGTELIPGKRRKASQLYPEVREQVRVALEHAQLGARTAQAQGQDDSRRL